MELVGSGPGWGWGWGCPCQRTGAAAEALQGEEGGGVPAFKFTTGPRTPNDPINLGAVFTKTVSYDFSNKYIFQSDGVLFRLNAS